jgi:hypothetical protein
MKKQPVFSKRHFFIALGLAFVMLVLSVTWVFAQKIASGGAIYACVLKDGTLRIVANASGCKKSETLLTWNILGPQGPQGLACWDLDGDGVADPEEDINGDGAWNAADCQGPRGAPGETGQQGAPGPAGGLARPGFSLTSVDSDDVVNLGSITIGADGLPVIVYEDRLYNVKVAHCADLACTSASLAQVGTAIGGYNKTSIAIGADGLPLISYFNGDYYLDVAHCTDPACSSVTHSQLGYHGGDGQTSITIGADGLPIISYARTSSLNAVHCNDAACSSASETLVDSMNGGTIQKTSITVGVDGLPVISYDLHIPHTIFRLGFAHCSDLVCSSADISILDNAADVRALSITIGADGLPLISYFDGENSDLKVAHCDDPACTSWANTTLDSGVGRANFYTSITIGADGLPLISYYDSTNLDLKVAHCSDLACSRAVLTTVDSAGDVGFDNSITVGTDGLPVISYLDRTNMGNYSLKVAHCSNAFCTPFVRRR